MTGRKFQCKDFGRDRENYEYKDIKSDKLGASGQRKF